MVAIFFSFLIARNLTHYNPPESLKSTGHQRRNTVTSMNDITDFILRRQSFARVTDPAPAGADLDAILACGLRAPDHAQLRPSRFLLIQGAGREALGEAFARAQLQDDPQADSATLDRARTRPLRAPLIIVGVTRFQAHPKVPPIEQSLSTGVAMGYMLLALEARGFGGIWRTGHYAYHPAVAEVLGLTEGEQVVGFLYAGTPAGSAPVKVRPTLEASVSRWP